ncbi:MAG: ArsR family transcriptional regulator, arsenate/arsenite/antimonite-responsive transcriptional [Fusobacteriaceae bacterium]|jgi:ArsR family transcriptional regulator|nr:ArsR family transcriptional regulator [Fusobacteriales bacterium]MDN5305074.1 ArsR family transcriptional regulator, arsenate/arsenite/antimonite-responsive transcriptional [Fusobacteriaceae bacterium]
MEIIDIIKALGDENRLRILNILYNSEFLCVCDIEEVLKLTQSNTSRHLNKLKMLNFINSEKKAQWVYYSINREILKRYSFIEEILKNLKEEVFINDVENLKIYLKNKTSC